MTVTICDVGPRDGLQNQPISLEPPVRAELVDLLAAAGVPRVEAVSFVSPKHVPQMAGAEDVVAAIERREGVVYAGLAVNERGYDRLRECELGEVHFAFAATEEFNVRNARASVDESVADAERIIARAAADGIRSTVTIGVAFGCPFEGAVDPARVLAIAARLAEAEPVEIALADTVGVAVPGQVRDLVGRMRETLPDSIRLRAHFHDTRATGIANAWAAWEAGADVLDSSLGGLGGCPFAPGATGNIVTEDLVDLLERTGLPTGIDLEQAIAVNRWFAGVIGKALPSSVARAGGFPR